MQGLQGTALFFLIKDQNPVRVLGESKIQNVFRELFRFPGFNDLLSRPFYADHLIYPMGTAPNLFDGAFQYTAAAGPFLVNDEALPVKCRS